MSERKKMTISGLFKKVADGQPITWVACYDYPTAYLQEQAGVDMILVGDSLGMTMLGYESTLPVTMDDMIRHTAAVRRGASTAWVILEGGAEMADRVAGSASAGIPVIGHLGLTPQSVSALGGFRLQGKGAAQAKKIVDDAKALEQAGAFCFLPDLVPDRVCQLITERAENCIIMSLGAGPHAHGQLLIYHDAFGLYPRFKPRMAKVFADAGEIIQQGLHQYVKEVSQRDFPQPENWFGMPDEEYEEL